MGVRGWFTAALFSSLCSKPCSTAAFIIAQKGLFKISQILKIFLKYFIFKCAMFKNKKHECVLGLRVLLISAFHRNLAMIIWGDSVDSVIHHTFREGASSVAIYKKSASSWARSEFVNYHHQCFSVSGSLYALAVFVYILLGGSCEAVLASDKIIRSFPPPLHMWHSVNRGSLHLSPSHITLISISASRLSCILYRRHLQHMRTLPKHRTNPKAIRIKSA